MKHIVLFSTCFFLFCIVVAGQKATVTAEAFFATDPKPKVVKVPLPAYPPTAAKGGLNGVVVVAIEVDDRGRVMIANATKGPGAVCPLVAESNVESMRTAAVAAAKTAIFEPPTLDGKRIQTHGILRYDFESGVTPKIEGVVVGTAAVDEVGKVVAVEGGSLGQAIAVPKPIYPPAARAVRASGPVQVQVVIGEDGNMYSAEAISGHPLLRSAAEIAACGARFSSFHLNGKPVKVAGMITYNFVP